MRERLRILCLGYIVRCPLGGMAWHHLQYVLGLARLGHDVYFLEDSDDFRWACYDPDRGVSDSDPTYGLRFASAVFDQLGLGERWIYYDAFRAEWFGSSASRVDEICDSADLLINLSGSNPIRPWSMRTKRRMFIDTDPGFTQLRHLTDPSRRQRAAQHNLFLSFGANMGKDGCTIPDDGIDWRPTRQPIVLDLWAVTPSPAGAPFTTVMQWDNTIQSVPREHAGRPYGRKAASFERYFDLPNQIGQTFEIALGGASQGEREQLRGGGWALRDPIAVSRTPWTYQGYIARSKAEFAVAKQAYVMTCSGWFSERSACYLASGRPVIVEDTRFSDWLPCGEGVLAFRSPEDVVACVSCLDADYETHCRRAREIAEEFFDARIVLQALIEAGATE
jgi:hypothetical protein